MNENLYHLLLGKSISEFNIEKDVVYNKNNNRHSYFFFENPFIYYNNSINTIFITVDENEIIKEIDIKLNSLIDEEFYKNLRDSYGEPKILMIKDGIISENEIKGEENKPNIKKTVHKARNGKFQEKPTFIIWENQNFKIEVLMKYEKNTSEITFSKKEKSKD